MKEKKWRIELTEHQLRLMAQCVEDCHRFIGGQMELSNSTACLEHHLELSEELGNAALEIAVTPLADITDYTAIRNAVWIMLEIKKALDKVAEQKK